jgi:hypothetical protein
VVSLSNHERSHPHYLVVGSVTRDEACWKALAVLMARLGKSIAQQSEGRAGEKAARGRRSAGSGTTISVYESIELVATAPDGHAYLDGIFSWEPLAVQLREG